jgi:hypothetical protein
MTTSTRPYRLSTALVLGLTATAALAEVPAGTKGTVWETTSTMEMPGMAMPPMTIRHCAPEGEWKEPPATQPKDSKCKVSDIKQSGKTTNWKMACDGEQKMSGQGTITRDGDAYSGAMTWTTSQGTMNMKTSGKKIGGACEIGKPLAGDGHRVPPGGPQGGPPGGPPAPGR